MARVLIHNPEILVLDQPTNECDAHAIERTMPALRKFVDLQGVEPHASRRTSRRPRTCFLSSGLRMGAQPTSRLIYSGTSARSTG